MYNPTEITRYFTNSHGHNCSFYGVFTKQRTHLRGDHPLRTRGQIGYQLNDLATAPGVCPATRQRLLG